MTIHIWSCLSENNHIQEKALCFTNFNDLQSYLAVLSHDLAQRVLSFIE
jgi:hypothetical protein